MKDDKVYLQHILDAIDRIEKYTVKVDRKAFLGDTLIQDAVIRQLEIIGEAAKLLSEDVKSKHSEVAWKDILGMRDKLIHGYFGVDLDAVWQTLEEDLPKLRDSVGNILR